MSTPLPSSSTPVVSRYRYELLCYEALGKPAPLKLGLESPAFDVANFLDWRETDSILNPPRMMEGMYTCPNPKCKSKKTQSWDKQTRSSDEPMTTFIQCTECNYQWRKNG